jgi:hypothetical protein
VLFRSLDSLQKIAIHIADKPPEDVFSWGVEKPVERVNDKYEALAGERDKWVEGLHQLGVGDSYEQCMYFWTQFCKYAADTLINKEQPVDMGFIKLHNCPYRSNWKAVLLSRYPNLGKSLAASKPEQRKEVADRAGLSEEMMSLDLLAMSKPWKGNSLCLRHIEVEHKPRWWRMIIKAERDRLASLNGPYNYASYYMSSVRSMFSRHLGIYINYLAQIARPCAEHVEGVWPGTFRLLPYWKRRVRYVEHHPLPTVVANKLPAFTPASVEEVLLVTHGGVPALPDMEQPQENLRNSPGGDVEKSGDGKG